VAVSFRTRWEKVFHAVEYVVDWGLQHRELTGVSAIGLDEIAWRKGHHYLMLVYQIDTGNTFVVGRQSPHRQDAPGFLPFFGKVRSQELKYVCSHMWQPYLKVIAKKTGQALPILDRFHIVAKLNKAVDEVMAGEHRQLQKDGYEPVLKHSRWCLLKRGGEPERKAGSQAKRPASV
jgi:transposase